MWRELTWTQLLVAAKANLHMTDNHGNTALHGNARSLSPDLALMEVRRLCLAFTVDSFLQVLIRAGALVDRKNKLGSTPLEYAVQYSALEVAEYLLESGARVSNFGGLHRSSFPPWFAHMMRKRKRCLDSARALYGVLRKRWRLSDGTRVPRDMINVLAQMVWATRRDSRWVRKVFFA